MLLAPGRMTEICLSIKAAACLIWKVSFESHVVVRKIRQGQLKVLLHPSRVPRPSIKVLSSDTNFLPGEETVKAPETLQPCGISRIFGNWPGQSMRALRFSNATIARMNHYFTSFTGVSPLGRKPYSFNSVSGGRSSSR